MLLSTMNQRKIIIMTISGVFNSSISRYSSRINAMKYKFKRTIKGHMYGIFHGDDNLFWVVSGRDIKKLRDAGYDEITNEK